MSEGEAGTAGESRAKRGRLPLILGIALAVAGGAGSFAAVRGGLLPWLPGGTEQAESPSAEEVAPLPEVAFLPLETIVISLGPAAKSRHLRFAAQLEVAPAHRDEVDALRPRIVDVLNGYLRALDESDLQAPGALMRLRAHMLRRVQLVAGEGRVRDLLVMEFVMT